MSALQVRALASIVLHSALRPWQRRYAPATADTMAPRVGPALTPATQAILCLARRAWHVPMGRTKPPRALEHAQPALDPPRRRLAAPLCRAVCVPRELHSMLQPTQFV